MKLRPLQDRVLIRRVEQEAKTSGGIIIPDTAQEKPMEGEVVAVGPGARGDAAPVAAVQPRRSLDSEIAALEVRMITEVLAETGNNRSEAARLLGISRVGLLKKLDRLGLR